MKKKTLIIIGIILLIAIPFGVNFLLKMNAKKMTDGRYYAVDCEEFPEAYVIVKGNTIQFYNIDLNSVYREEQLDSVYKKQDNENMNFNTGLSDEKLFELSDLNDMFVNNKYEYDIDNGWKKGTFTYLFRCMGYGNWFGLSLSYDAWNRTITINNYQLQITFKRK